VQPPALAQIIYPRHLVAQVLYPRHALAQVIDPQHLGAQVINPPLGGLPRFRDLQIVGVNATKFAPHKALK